LKFNLKAGGTNHVMAPPKLGIISQGKTMVLGIDVTHPSAGAAASAMSVAGMVASVDSTLAQWPGIISVQRPSPAGSAREMVDELTPILKSRLELWEARNKTLPDNIIIYRDGISEGQYDLCLTRELPRLRDACNDKRFEHYYKKAGPPMISIIIVGKRHHTRFYPAKRDDASNTHNCKPGTVVDRGVTQARTWEFYLQAHHCIQGTARPAHYVVILDEIFRNQKVKADQRHQHAADALEDLTHNMCHLFGRATKAVSICPPAYYADILCERARCYLAQHFEPDDTSSAASTTPAGRLLSQMSQQEFAGLSQTRQNQLQQEADNLRNQQQSLVNIHPSLKDTMFYI
jgi:eukaryotic translation initiation factor 2C